MGEFLLPDEDRQYDFFMRTSTILGDAGYVHYEVSNFARNKNLVSRHNSKYWNHTPYLGLGPAAHSLAENRRWWNKGSLSEYLADIHSGKAPIATSETLSTEALRLEALFLGFRTKEGIHLENFNTRFECDLLEEKAETLEILQNSGFIKIEDGYLRPTPSGLAVADSLSLI
jgi:coproporphyrinogen III oxidase-like Fe-S oxidoreductase